MAQRLWATTSRPLFQKKWCTPFLHPPAAVLCYDRPTRAYSFIPVFNRGSRQSGLQPRSCLTVSPRVLRNGCSSLPDGLISSAVRSHAHYPLTYIFLPVCAAGFSACWNRDGDTRVRKMWQPRGSRGGHVAVGIDCGGPPVQRPQHPRPAFSFLVSHFLIFSYSHSLPPCYKQASEQASNRERRSILRTHASLGYGPCLRI